MSSPRAALSLLAVAAGLGGLTVAVSYGFAVEYADAAAPWWASALDGLHWWWPGVAVVAVLGLGATLLAWGSRPVRWAAAVLVLGTAVATGGGAAVGAAQKLDRLPSTPDCVAELTSGPAAPVVREAQAAFEELDHPGPFTGGGSSGVDGCSSDLVLREGTDPRPGYRDSLAAHGWALLTGRGGGVRAVRGGQEFELSRVDGGWTVWIGPAGMTPREVADGEVGPRRRTARP